MYASKAVILVASAASAWASASSSAEDCAKKCNEEFDACRVAPDANMSFCASKLASCVNYNPWASSFVSPTACSATSAPSTTSASTTASASATSASGSAEDCAKKCNEEYNACRVAPDANMSFCASKLASCVNYNPWASSFVSPTACSATSAPSTTSASATATATSSASGSAEDCAKKCNEEYNACRVAPDANMSFCASKLASCVNYNPWASSFVSPTACSTQSASTSAGAAYTTEVVTAYTTYCPVATVLTMNNKTYAITTPTTITITDCPCTVQKPVSSSAATSAPWSTSVSTGTPSVTTPSGAPSGTIPGTTPTTSLPVTAGASHMAPAVALIALCAVAAML